MEGKSMKQLQKWLSIILTIILMATVWNLSPGKASYAVSLDTVPVGYVGIYTASDLNNIRNNLHGKYILMNNVDLSDYASGNGWLPIGSIGVPFSGTLDGNGYTISNLTLNQASGADYPSIAIGLFSYVAGGTISNLTIQATAAYSADTYSSLAFGTIAGVAKRITVDNCQVQISGTIKGGEISASVDVGGLIGRNDAYLFEVYQESDDPNQFATITNCHVTGELNATGQELSLGGLVGYGRDVLIQNSSNAAKIYCLRLVNYETYNLAGIVGYGRAFHLENVSNSGMVYAASETEAFGESRNKSAGIINEGHAVVDQATRTSFPKSITAATNSGYIKATNYNCQASGIIVTNGGEVHLLGCANLGDVDVINDQWGIASGITISSIGSIVECYNAGDIHSRGLACGIAYKNIVGEIQECYNSGIIEGGEGAAGLLYQNMDLVEDCYNAGYVRGLEASGITLYNASYALVNNCYNVGGIECTAQAASGIAGDNEAVVGDTFYYENTSVGVANNDNAGIDESEKIYTMDLFEEETYAGFDFGEPIIEYSPQNRIRLATGATTGVWRMSSNSGMPVLNDAKEIYVKSISVVAKPTKYYHLINESIHTSGLVLKVTMSDGSYTYINKGFVLKPYSKSSGTRNITVVYNGKTTTFPINFSSITAPTTSYTAAKVEWTGTSKATSYKIYRATSASGTYQLVYTAKSTARSYVNTGLTTGKTYYYKVRPMFGTTYGTASTARAVKIVPGTPSLTAEPGGWLSWKAVSGSYYEVWRASSLAGTYKLLKTTSALSYLTPEVSGGTTYFYKIRAYHTENGVKIYGNWSYPRWIIK
jgi:hypothetical protein